MSDYNVPYILPRVAVASVLARRPDGAAEAIRALLARGTRGRSIDADRLTVEAGIAALAGDREAALAGYRAGLAAYRDLSLQVDEALLALQAATTLGAQDPEVAGWVDGGRAILTRLRATPLIELLDRAADGAPAAIGSHQGGDPPTPWSRGRSDRGPSGDGVQPGDHVPAQGLDDLRIPDVPGVEDHVLRAGVRELPEPVDDLGRRVARPVVGLELHRLERRALDLRGIAADRLAVLAQDLVLVVDPDRVAEHVARVGVLGHEPERLPLARRRRS